MAGENNPAMFAGDDSTGFDGQPRWSRSRGGANAEKRTLQERLVDRMVTHEPVPAPGWNEVASAWGVVPNQQGPSRFDGALAAYRERIETGVSPNSGGLRSVESIRADRRQQDEAADAARTTRTEQLRSYAGRHGNVEDVMSLDELLDPGLDDLVSDIALTDAEAA